MFRHAKLDVQEDKVRIVAMITQRALIALRVVALVGLVAGCSPTGSTQSPAVDPKPAPNTKSAPGPDPNGPGPAPQKPASEAPKSDPPKQDQEAPKTETAQKDDGRDKKPNNPDRIYQLNDLQIVKIKVGKNTFKTWVMDTMPKQEEGLMHISDAEIKIDEAMIFVYNQPREMSFWMRNTKIPLDIAFVGGDKVILNVATMKPFDESLVPSKGPAQYAIEFKTGTCKKLGIKAGMKVDIPKDLKLIGDEQS
jgi:uncharacterized protein